MNPTGIEAAEEAEVFADRAWWQAAGDVLNLQLHGWTYRLNASFVDRETKAYVALTGAMANRLLALAKPSLPADVAGLVERLRADADKGSREIHTFERVSGKHASQLVIDCVQAADTITSLSARAEAAEAERDRLATDAIVAPAECDEECDDPDCPYQHKPLTLRKAYENAVSRMRDAEDTLRRHHRAMADVQERLSTAEAALATAREKALEEAAKAVEAEAKTFLSPEYAANQPLGSLLERFACDECAKAIRSLTGVSSK